jgi:hypothetical protein
MDSCQAISILFNGGRASGNERDNLLYKSNNIAAQNKIQDRTPQSPILESGVEGTANKVNISNKQQV